MISAQTKNNDGSFPVGYKQKYFFDRNGWFEGKVTNVYKSNVENTYTIYFQEDRSNEEYTQAQMEQYES